MSDRSFSWAYQRHDKLFQRQASAKLVLMALAEYVQLNDACTLFAKVADIAAKSGQLERTVWRALTALEEAELIAVFDVKGAVGRQTANRYVLNLEGLHGAAWTAYAGKWAEQTEDKGEVRNRRQRAPKPEPAAKQPRLFVIPRKPRKPRKRKEAPVGVLRAMDEPTTPVGPNDERVWTAALAEIRLQMRSEDFRAWLETSDVLSHDGAEWVIEVDNESTAEWLSLKVQGPVLRALVGLTGDADTTVRFVPKPEPAW